MDLHLTDLLKNPLNEYERSEAYSRAQFRISMLCQELKVPAEARWRLDISHSINSLRARIIKADGVMAFESLDACNDYLQRKLDDFYYEQRFGKKRGA